MSEHTFTEWITIVMAFNVPPQVVMAYLYMRWRNVARKPWVRNMLLLVAFNALAFGLARVSSTFFLDSLLIRFMTAVYVIASGYLTTMLFWILTDLIERRLARQERVGRKEEKTSDIIRAIIDELRAVNVRT